MRASFSLECRECDTPTRFVAEAIDDHALEIVAAFAGCDCCDRPSEEEAAQEAAQIFDDRAEADWWGALYQKWPEAV